MLTPSLTHLLCAATLLGSRKYKTAFFSLPDTPSMRFKHPVKALFTDIDDTLTTQGALTADARAALQALAAAGVPVVAITGRPVGWSAGFLQGVDGWPVRAIVAENGAVMLLPRLGAAPQKRYVQSDAERSANFTRLQAVLAQIEVSVAGAKRAQDSIGRETDIAVDHSEFTHLPPKEIEATVQMMRAAGLTATVSSIHINGWIGPHSKLSGALWALAELWPDEQRPCLDDCVYVGDSTNDELMFEAFKQSVGVANIQRFWERLVHKPRWVTKAERGAGFAEVAAAVLRGGQ